MSRSKVALAFAMALTCSTALPLAVADILVFKDGDRVQGNLQRVEGETLVFRTNRFGEIRVNRAEASLELSSAPTASVAAMDTVEPVSRNSIETHSTPEVARGATTKALAWWNLWTGRLSFGTESIQDTNNRKALLCDVQVSRKWTSNQFTGELHYQYREQDGTKQNDELKISGYWKRALPTHLFTVYRPVFEWNRQAYVGGVFTPYAIVQQELGVGYALVQRPKQTVSVGVSENLFHGWALNSPLRVNRQVESVFVEAEVILPFGTKFTERAVAYYSSASGRSGAENTTELTRKLTEKVSVGLRQQYQRNLPDLRLQNYRRLRFFLGYDF